MKTVFPYTRVPGRKRGVLASSTLWMGDDHLLLVRNSRFSETYKRFFYSDIEALLIRRGPRFSVPAYWLVSVSAVLFAMPFLALAPHRGSLWITLAILTLLVIYLAIESLFLSCTTHIKTAVSSEELDALFRTRHALKAAQLIAARVEIVQGAAEPGEVQNPDLSARELPMPVVQNESPPSRTALGLSLASFLFLFVDAAFTYYSGLGQLTPRMTAVNSVLILAEAVLLISALVALWPGTSARGLRNLIIATLAFSGSAYYAGSMGSQIGAAVAQANGQTQALVFSTYRAVVNRIDEIGNIALGIAGLIVWRKSARS